MKTKRIRTGGYPRTSSDFTVFSLDMTLQVMRILSIQMKSFLMLVYSLKIDMYSLSADSQKIFFWVSMERRFYTAEIMLFVFNLF